MEMYQLGHDYVPTNENVERFIDMGLAAARAGDPALLGFCGSAFIGFILWAGVCEFDIREPVCVSVLTYIVPECRRQGLARQLRTAGMLVARERGYARVDGFALETSGMRLMEKEGWTQLGHVYRKGV